MALGSVVAEIRRAPAGWRVALAAELAAAGMRQGGKREPCQYFYYYQAGWIGNTWGGVQRYWFVTADWETVNPTGSGAVHAMDGEGRAGVSGDYLRTLLPNKHFTGAVFVRHGYRAEDCPAPAFPSSETDSESDVSSNAGY